MGADHHHDHPHSVEGNDSAYRRILWIALVINFTMFSVEISASIRSHSVSLLADSVDFFGDGLNYGLSLMALGMMPTARSKVALLKGFAMAAFGIAVLGRAAYLWKTGAPPEALTMGLVGLLALVCNVFVAFLLYRYRNGDANMRSVWLCSRNDAISNLLVVAAALGVWGAASNLPDLAVASVMGILALTSAWQVIQQANKELKH